MGKTYIAEEVLENRTVSEGKNAFNIRFGKLKRLCSEVGDILVNQSLRLDGRLRQIAAQELAEGLHSRAKKATVEWYVHFERNSRPAAL